MSRFSSRVGGALALSLALVLPACGGDDGGWDEFRPRAATAVDLAGRSFTFTGFQYGAVFDASLSTTTTVLAFGATASVPGGQAMAHSVAARGATARGEAVLAGDSLTLSFSEAPAALPFTLATQLRLRVESDVDDGRIRLTNLDTGLQQTSAP
jgi:hypothetical protein